MEALGVLTVAVFVFGYGLVSRRLALMWVSGPMVFVALGLVTGSSVLDIVDLSVDNGTLLSLAEATLGIVLFSDAARIDLKRLREQVLLPSRLLAIGLPLTIVAGTLAAWILFDHLAVVEAALLGAILAPTDAALGQEVVTNRSVPVRIRQALNVESGLNDGIVVPVVTVLVVLAAAEAATGPRDWLVLGLEEIGYGLVFGFVIGAVGGWLVRGAHARGWIDGVFLQLATLSVPVMAYLAADGVGGSGFIATFSAGIVFGAITRISNIGDFTEDLGQLLSMITFMLFGVVLVGPALGDLTWQIAIYAVLSLTLVRMIPVALSLMGSGFRPVTVSFIGWFGPRGLASILFLLVVVDEADLPGSATLNVAVTVTVLLSIFAHGLTARPFAESYARSIAVPDVAVGSMETQHVEEMRVRTYTPDTSVSP